MNFRSLFVLSFLSLASCKQASQTVAVVGDSWATYVCAYKSLDKAFGKAGLIDAATQSACSVTTKPGVRADEWLQTPFHEAAKKAIQDKTVKVLYLSLGGNDILNYWNKSMTAAEENAVFDSVIEDIQTAVSEYQNIRPDIRIILSGYDFPRFTTDHAIPEYNEAFDEMGRPSPYELNTAVIRFSDRVSKIADQKKLFYIHHYGLMHYFLGNSEMGLLPFKALSPELISTPGAVNQFGGDVRFQADPAGMFTIKVGNKIVVDAFHLNRFGYDKIAEHTVFHYLRHWLK